MRNKTPQAAALVIHSAVKHFENHYSPILADLLVCLSANMGGGGVVC